MLALYALSAPAASLVAGQDHTCVLREGAVWCWGDGLAAPAPVPGTAGATDLSSGTDHVCALLPDGAACFRVGGGAPVRLGEADRVVAGDGLSCTVEGGEVACVGGLRVTPPPPEPSGGGGAGRGYGGIGTIGVPKPPPRPPPPGGPAVVAGVPSDGLAVGDGAVCGLEGGRARCAGYDPVARVYGPFTLPAHDVRAVVAVGRDFWTLDRAGVVRRGHGSGPQAVVSTPTGVLDDVRELIGGPSGWCARAADGVWCGHGDDAVRVPAFDTAVALAPGGGHQCAELAGGSVSCRGTGASGALGSGPIGRADAAEVVAGISDAVGIAAGAGFSCAARRGAAPVCWGDAPAGVEGIGVATTITAGDDHVCAEVGGAVRCAGNDHFGQLGDGEGRPPQRVVLPGPAARVAVAYGDGACAIVGEGSAARPWCWGAGEALHAIDLVGVTALALEMDHACGVVGGKVWCWGDDRVPTALPGISGARTLSLGLVEDCATTAEGAVWCWDDGRAPARVAGVSKAVAVDTLAGHSCAALDGGSVVCWNAEGDGRAVGRGSEDSAEGMVPVDLKGVVEVATGPTLTCGRREDGGVTCVGGAAGGLAGDGIVRSAEYDSAMEAQRTDVRVPPLVDLAMSASTWPNACGATKAGEVYCWGDDYYGVLRDADTVPTGVATRVTGLPGGVVEVSTSSDAACARTGDGEVWCWGQADDRSPVPPRTAATTVAGLPGPASKLRSGGNTSCALSGGEVWCWGWNPVHDEREYDDPEDPLHSGVPGRVPALGLPEHLAVSDWGACAATHGETRCVGMDIHGSLGPSPEEIPAEQRRRSPPPPPPEPARTGLERSIAENAGILGTMGSSVEDVFGAGGLGSGIGEVLGSERYGGLVGGLPPAPAPAKKGPEQAVQPIAAKALAQGPAGSCAIRVDHVLVCWGGVGDPSVREVARDVAAVGVGEELGCYVTRAGAVSCWTRGGGPVAVPGVADAVEVAVGKAHACARLRDGRVACWGDDGEGQLGRSLAPRASEPRLVAFP